MTYSIIGSGGIKGLSAWGRQWGLRLATTFVPEPSNFPFKLLHSSAATFEELSHNILKNMRGAARLHLGHHHPPATFAKLFAFWA